VIYDIQYETKIARLLYVVNKKDRFLPIVSQTPRTCGKRSCVCHSNASRRHGPNTYPNFSGKEGKSSVLYTSSEDLAEATEASEAVADKPAQRCARSECTIVLG